MRKWKAGPKPPQARGLGPIAGAAIKYVPDRRVDSMSGRPTFHQSERDDTILVTDPCGLIRLSGDPWPLPIKPRRLALLILLVAAHLYRGGGVLVNWLTARQSAEFLVYAGLGVVGSCR
jgi:hypothetical protein